MDIKTIISDIFKEKAPIGGVDSVVFAACGGSFSTLFPAKYLLETKSKELKIGHYSSNEFLHTMPSYVGKNSIIITISHKGETPETVQVAKKAQEIGAASIVLTFDGKSALAGYGDYVLLYQWGETIDQNESNVIIAMKLAAEILNQKEHWILYDTFLHACALFTDVTYLARTASKERAAEFAKTYKKEPLMYVMGSGFATYAAYSFAICILMEMQWIHSSSIHSGEYFHGPFEITDPEVPFILLKSYGSTRPLDERAHTFLKKYGKKIILLDAEELGLGNVGEEVAELFNHMFFTVVLREYANQLAKERNHPLSERRYMWKVEY